jgi:hypothetical protein
MAHILKVNLEEGVSDSLRLEYIFNITISSGDYSLDFKKVLVEP